MTHHLRTYANRLPAGWPVWAGLLAVELVAVGAYLAVGSVYDPRYLVYPFVWINLGLYAVARVDPAASSTRRRALAAAAAVAYFLALGWITGLVGLPLDHAHAHSYIANGWHVSLSAPGWGPRVAYKAGHAHLYFVPYRVVGYAALAYLLYAGLLDATATAGAGVLGLVSCVGCAFPLVASLAAGVGTASFAAAVTGYSLDLSTLVFVAAVALLSWRPGG